MIEGLMDECIRLAEGIYQLANEEDLLNDQIWLDFADKLNEISIRG